jgi:tetratricopeptide (TPR) repeat protein
MAVKREQVVQTAEKYVARGKIEPAIREYRKLLEENPNDINTLNRVGDLYARIQRIDEAVDFFNQIAEQYAGEGFFVKAIAIYKKIIKLDPTRLDVYENLAELYHRQGLVTEARTQYQVLADYYQKHENATSTIAIYQKMADLEPNNPTYHVKLAELYQQQQLIEKAMGEYRIIAELMLTHGHPQEAAQVYERALAIDSSNLAFITDAALKLKEAAGTAITVRFLSAAVERNPQAAQVARMIGGGAAAAFPGGLGGTRAGIASPAAPPAPAPPAAAPAAAVSAPAPSAPRAPAAPAAPPTAPGDVSRGPSAVPPPRQAPDLDLDLDMEIDLELGSELVVDELAGPSPPADQGLPSRAPRARREDGEADEEDQELPASRFGRAAGYEPAFEVDEETASGAAGQAGAAAGAAGAQGWPEQVPADGDADLEDVFVLDIEDEEEPASLVKPPPDMLREPRRPSWAQEASPAAGSTAPPPLGPGAAPPRVPVPPPLEPAAAPPLRPGMAPPLGAAPAASAAGAAGPELPERLPELPELRLTGEFELINPFATFDQPVDVAGGAGRQDLLRPFRAGQAAPPAAPPPSRFPDAAVDPRQPAVPPSGAVAEPPPGAEPPAPPRLGPPAALGPAGSEVPGGPAVPAEALAMDGVRAELSGEGAGLGGSVWPAGAAPGTGTPSAPAAEIRPEGPPAPGTTGPPAIKIDSDLLERTAAELLPPAVERYEDLVSEAEVLAKYGLEEKAIERLREAVRLRPRHFAAYLLLVQLQLDKGRHARVIELANQVSRLSETGDREPWAKLRRRLLAAGYRLDGDRVASGPQLPGATERGGAARPSRPRAAAPAAPVAAADAPAAAADAPAVAASTPPPAVPGEAPPATAGQMPSAPADQQAAAGAATPGVAPARRSRKATDTRTIETMLEGLVDRPPRSGRAAKKAAPAVPAAPAAPPAAPAETAPPPAAVEHPAAAAAASAAAPAGSEQAAAAAAMAVPAIPAPAPAVAERVEPPAGPVLPPLAGRDDLALPAAAAAATHDLVELPPLLAPGEEAAPPPDELRRPIEIFNPLEIGAMVESEEIDWSDDGAPRPGFAAGPAPAGAPPIGAGAAAAAASVVGAGEIFTAPAGALGSLLPPSPPPLPPPAATGGPGPSAAPAPAAGLDDTGGMSWLDEADSGKNRAAARAASLFDEEEDFFDLAGELAQELSQEPVFQGDEQLIQQEQSLEEIVEGFKRGVSEHLSPTDYDTHFNLGIAYREMGLLDEAIGEFQLSAKDPHFLVSCCSMLGLCFLDKGLPELAIKWYRRGLEAETISEEDTLGLLYDMGCAYLAMGDQAGAYKTFVDAYGINTNYRDVVARIEELGRPR